MIRLLVDVVSKNGNLLLNIPVKGDGSIDNHEMKILEEIACWMNVNQEAIFETRPWHIFGEGPVAERENPIRGQGFNEGIIRSLTSKDIRFTRKDKQIYAIVMAWPEDRKITLKSLATDSTGYEGVIIGVELLGGQTVSYKRDAEGLKITISELKSSDMPLVLKIRTT